MWLDCRRCRVSELHRRGPPVSRADLHTRTSFQAVWWEVPRSLRLSVDLAGINERSGVARGRAIGACQWW